MDGFYEGVQRRSVFFIFFMMMETRYGEDEDAGVLSELFED